MTERTADLDVVVLGGAAIVDEGAGTDAPRRITERAGRCGTDVEVIMSVAREDVRLS